MTRRPLYAALTLFFLVLAGCQPPTPDNPDWCYTFDYTSGDYGSTLTSAVWEEGHGLVSAEDGLLSFSYDYGRSVTPSSVIVTAARGEGVTGTIDVSATAILFGISASASQQVTEDVDTLALTLPATSASDSGPTISITVQSTSTIYLQSIEVRGMGANPFPTNGCGPTATPAATGTSITPTGTETATVSPTATPTDTPSITWTPSATPIPAPLDTFNINVKTTNYTLGSYVLQSGVQYRVTVMGYWVATGVVWVDAKWLTSTGNWNSRSEVSSVDFNGGRGKVQPIDSTFNNDHYYEYLITGTGTVLGARVDDSGFNPPDYGNNSGTMTVRVWSLQSPTEMPTATASVTNTSTPTSTSSPTPTRTPIPTWTSTSAPASRTPIIIGSPTPVTPAVTNTPLPTATPKTPTATHTHRPTNTPPAVNTQPPTLTPRATNTSSGPTATWPWPTYTPLPHATSIPTPSGGSADDSIPFLSGISEALNNLSDWLSSSLNNLSDMISQELNKAANALGYWFGQLQGWVNGIVDTIQTMYDGFTTWLLGIIQSILNWISSIINAWVEWIYDTFLKIVEWILSLIRWVLGFLSNLLSLAVNLIMTLFYFGRQLVTDIFNLIRLAIAVLGYMAQLGWGWIVQVTSAGTVILTAWFSTPPTPIPGLPQCVSHPLDYDICAIYYILRYTIFAGVIGALIIPLVVLHVDVSTIFYFIRTVIRFIRDFGNIIRIMGGSGS